MNFKNNSQNFLTIKYDNKEEKCSNFFVSCKTPCNYQRDNDPKLKTTFILTL